MSQITTRQNQTHRNLSSICSHSIKKIVMNHPSYSNGYYDAYQHQYYAIDAKYDPYHVAFKTQSMEAMLTYYVPRRKRLSTMAINVANKTCHIFAKSVFSLLDHIRIDNKPPRRFINNNSDSMTMQEKPIENDWEIVESTLPPRDYY